MKERKSNKIKNVVKDSIFQNISQNMRMLSVTWNFVYLNTLYEIFYCLDGFSWGLSRLNVMGQSCFV